MPLQDTADMFAKPERGRFGDNEQHRPGSGPRVTGASDLIDVTLTLRRDNPLSITVSDDKGRWISLPKSQIEYCDLGHGEVEVTMPEWLAIRERLV